MSYHGRELEFQLQPIGAEAFLSTHWERRALHVPGTPGKFEPLYTTESWWRAAKTTDWAQASDRHGHHVMVTPEQIEPLYEAGLSICARTHHEPKLRRFLRGLVTRIQVPGPPYANCYVSKDGTGLPLHFDAYHVFVLQIEGEKEWHFSARPAVPSPIRNASFSAGDAVSGDGRPFFDDSGTRIEKPPLHELGHIVMKPGDLLYLPPGTWHTARARGHSVAVSLGPARPRLLEFILRTIQTELERHSEWRVSLPAALEPDGCGSAVPDSIASSLRSSLETLRSAIERLDPRLLEKAWCAELAGGARARTRSRVAIQAGDVLRRPDGERFRYCIAPREPGEMDALWLFAAGEHALLPVEARGFVDELAKRERFVADEAGAWIRDVDWPDVKSLLEDLVEAGFLELDGATVD